MKAAIKKLEDKINDVEDRIGYLNRMIGKRHDEIILFSKGKEESIVEIKELREALALLQSQVR